MDTKLKLVSSSPSLSELEKLKSKIISFSRTKTEYSLLIGDLLLKIKEGKLFRCENKYRSFSSWLTAFSKESDIVNSTLWMCLRTAHLIVKIGITREKAMLAPITGLNAVASLYKLHNDILSAQQDINDLLAKKVKVADLVAKLNNIRTKRIFTVADITTITGYIIVNNQLLRLDSLACVNPPLLNLAIIVAALVITSQIF